MNNLRTIEIPNRKNARDRSKKNRSITYNRSKGCKNSKDRKNRRTNKKSKGPNS